MSEQEDRKWCDWCEIEHEAGIAEGKQLALEGAVEASMMRSAPIRNGYEAVFFTMEPVSTLTHRRVLLIPLPEAEDE